MSTITSTIESREAESLVAAVVTTVAGAEGVSPLELDPLGTVLDAEALESLVAPDAGRVVVEFGYAGYDVTVESPEGRPLTVEAVPRP